MSIEWVGVSNPCVIPGSLVTPSVDTCVEVQEYIAYTGAVDGVYSYGVYYPDNPTSPLRGDFCRPRYSIGHYPDTLRLAQSLQPQSLSGSRGGGFRGIPTCCFRSVRKGSGLPA
ncbi:MAG: hypothetical protein QGG33_02315 [Candidatus Krumholzibacteria bacterium]|nr:hypothetical protein [Candidatus Krumholzibacteria bacterium]